MSFSTHIIDCTEIFAKYTKITINFVLKVDSLWTNSELVTAFMALSMFISKIIILHGQSYFETNRVLTIEGIHFKISPVLIYAYST